MHRHRTAKAVRRLNLTAFHFIFNILLAFVAMGTLGYGLVMGLSFWQTVGACILGFWLMSAFIFFIRQSNSRCPLCMVPLWGNQKCNKNSNVKPAFGISYRLTSASSVLLKGRYRCPYCGEPFSARESRESKGR